MKRTLLVDIDNKEVIITTDSRLVGFLAFIVAALLLLLFKKVCLTPSKINFKLDNVPDYLKSYVSGNSYKTLTALRLSNVYIPQKTKIANLLGVDFSEDQEE